jgi:hypothetical protein
MNKKHKPSNQLRRGGFFNFVLHLQPIFQVFVILPFFNQKKSVSLHQYVAKDIRQQYKDNKVYPTDRPYYFAFTVGFSNSLKDKSLILQDKYILINVLPKSDKIYKTDFLILK